MLPSILNFSLYCIGENPHFPTAAFQVGERTPALNRFSSPRFGGLQNKQEPQAEIFELFPSSGARGSAAHTHNH